MDTPKSIVLTVIDFERCPYKFDKVSFSSCRENSCVSGCEFSFAAQNQEYAPRIGIFLIVYHFGGFVLK